jgi:hypothetical protein
LPVGATGWRAESPGEQTIRLLFREEKEARTQEFVLRWSPTADGLWLIATSVLTFQLSCSW